MAYGQVHSSPDPAYVNPSAMLFTGFAGRTTSTTSTQNPATVAQWNYSGGNTDVTGGAEDWTFGILQTSKKEYIGCGWSATAATGGAYNTIPTIYKLDHLGNLVWAKPIPNVTASSSYEGGAIWQVIQASDGYIGVGFGYDNNTLLTRTILVEFDDNGVFHNGTPMFVDPYGYSSCNSRGYGIALDPNHNSVDYIVTAGFVYPNPSLPPGAVISLFHYNGSTYVPDNSQYISSSYPGGASFCKVLTKSVPGTTSYYDIYACGTISAGSDDQTTAWGLNADAAWATTLINHSNILMVSCPSTFSSYNEQQWNKSNLNSIVYNDVGKVTARNIDGSGFIKYVDPALYPGPYVSSPITEYYAAYNNKACQGQDMIFTRDNKIALTAGVNYIHLTIYYPNQINGAYTVIGGGYCGGDSYDEYTDQDAYLIKVNPSDLSIAYNKNVGHFSGSDYRIKLMEDKYSRFIIAGSTADNYNSTDPNLPNNHDGYAENAFIVCAPDNSTGTDLWRRSYASWPNEDCACIFAIAPTADDGYVICGNNDNNNDDYTITKFAPLEEQAYLSTSSYATFSYSSPPDMVTLSSGTTTWSSPMNIASEVIVPSGATLNISGTTISFAASDQLWDYFLFNDAAMDNNTAVASEICGSGTASMVTPFPNGRMVGIVVQPGGVLNITNSTLQGINFPTVGDRNMWDGIVVQGTYAASETAANQGEVNISSSSVIKDARFGVYVADNWRSYLNTAGSVTTGITGTDHYNNNNFSSRYDGTCADGGGIVTASNTTFLNCRFGAFFENYFYPDVNPSSISNCIFNSDATGMGDICFYTDQNGSPVPANTHVGEVQWNTLSLTQNVFECDPSYVYSVQPVGVSMYGSGGNIGLSGSSTSGNTFQNLNTGVALSAGCGSFATTVLYNTFQNNITGINASGQANNLSIESNNFYVPYYSPSAYFPMGINLFVCRGYSVRYNNFDRLSPTSSYGWMGIVVNDGCTQDETIANNTFNHYSLGAEALQWNGNGTGSTGTGLQFRCNQFTNTFDPIYVGSIRSGSPPWTGIHIRPYQGNCSPIGSPNPADPAGNQFFTSCASISYNLYADSYVSDYITYNNNGSGSTYDPQSCIYPTTVIDNIGCTPVSGSSCPLFYHYTMPEHITALTTLEELDATISTTTDPGTLADLWAQHDAITSYLARYYAMNSMYDSAAIMFANYSKYRDALPFYIQAGDYTDAQTMHNNLPMVTGEDTLYAWESQLAINLYSVGNTWLNIDTASLDSMKKIVQYNSAAGGMAGGICALLGAAPVTYPIPGIDANILDTILAHEPNDTGEGERMAHNGQQVNKTLSDGLFQVYPNPTSGLLTVTSSSGGTLTLYTIFGQQVQQYVVTLGGGSFVLPTGLAAGMYIGKFKPDDGSGLKEVRLVYNPQ